MLMSRCTQSLPCLSQWQNRSRAKDPLKVPKEVGRLQETLQERFLMIFESNVVSNKETMMERNCQCRKPEILWNTKLYSWWTSTPTPWNARSLWYFWMPFLWLSIWFLPVMSCGNCRHGVAGWCQDMVDHLACEVGCKMVLSAILVFFFFLGGAFCDS